MHAHALFRAVGLPHQAHRALRLTKTAGQSQGGVQMAGAALGPGIINDADKIGLKGRRESFDNGFPRREQITQADAGKIVRQGSAQQGSGSAYGLSLIHI